MHVCKDVRTSHNHYFEFCPRAYLCAHGQEKGAAGSKSMAAAAAKIAQREQRWGRGEATPIVASADPAASSQPPSSPRKSEKKPIGADRGPLATPEESQRESGVVADVSKLATKGFGFITPVLFSAPLPLRHSHMLSPETLSARPRLHVCWLARLCPG